VRHQIGIQDAVQIRDALRRFVAHSVELGPLRGAWGTHSARLAQRGF